MCGSGGPLELVSHKQSGFLSEPNVEGLADGFKYLMSLTPIQRREFGDRGHDWVMANLSWSNVANSLSSIGKDEKEINVQDYWFSILFLWSR